MANIPQGEPVPLENILRVLQRDALEGFADRRPIAAIVRDIEYALSTNPQLPDSLRMLAKRLNAAEIVVERLRRGEGTVALNNLHVRMLDSNSLAAERLITNYLISQGSVSSPGISLLPEYYMAGPSVAAMETNVSTPEQVARRRQNLNRLSSRPAGLVGESGATLPPAIGTPLESRFRASLTNQPTGLAIQTESLGDGFYRMRAGQFQMTIQTLPLNPRNANINSLSKARMAGIASPVSIRAYVPAVVAELKKLGVDHVIFIPDSRDGRQAARARLLTPIANEVNAQLGSNRPTGLDPSIAHTPEQVIRTNATFSGTTGVGQVAQEDFSLVVDETPRERYNRIRRQRYRRAKALKQNQFILEARPTTLRPAQPVSALQARVQAAIGQPPAFRHAPRTQIAIPAINAPTPSSLASRTLLLSRGVPTTSLTTGSVRVVPLGQASVRFPFGTTPVPSVRTRQGLLFSLPVTTNPELFKGFTPFDMSRGQTSPASFAQSVLNGPGTQNPRPGTALTPVPPAPLPPALTQLNLNRLALPSPAPPVPTTPEAVGFFRRVARRVTPDQAAAERIINAPTRTIVATYVGAAVREAASTFVNSARGPAAAAINTGRSLVRASLTLGELAAPAGAAFEAINFIGELGDLARFQNTYINRPPGLTDQQNALRRALLFSNYQRAHPEEHSLLAAIVRTPAAPFGGYSVPINNAGVGLGGLTVEQARARDEQLRRNVIRSVGGVPTEAFPGRQAATVHPATVEQILALPTPNFSNQ